MEPRPFGGRKLYELLELDSSGIFIRGRGPSYRRFLEALPRLSRRNDRRGRRGEQAGGHSDGYDLRCSRRRCAQARGRRIPRNRPLRRTPHLFHIRRGAEDCRLPHHCLATARAAARACAQTEMDTDARRRHRCAAPARLAAGRCGAHEQSRRTWRQGARFVRHRAACHPHACGGNSRQSARPCLAAGPHAADCGAHGGVPGFRRPRPGPARRPPIPGFP